MKKIKKVMATVLLLCMISSMLVVSAAADEITASEISLNYVGKTLAVGGSFELKALFEPEGAAPNVTWASDDVAVASVNESGIVTGAAPGTTVITASAYEGQLTAKCTVTVVATSEESPIVYADSVSLGEQTSLNLEPYGYATLVATVAPESATNKFVAWVSSDETVVTVDESGIVYAANAGTATVYAIAADVDLTAEDLSIAAIASCTVTVSQPYTAPATVAVNSIVINPAELTLTAGEAAYVSATVNEDATDKSLTWASSDSNVASYADGAVYAVGAGSATISATANDGSGVVGYCYVTVNPAAPATVAVNSIVINPAELTLTAGGAAYVSATVNEDATDKSLTWASSDSNVASYADGAVYAVGAGSATISATANDGSGVVGYCYVTVNPAAPATVAVNSIVINPAELTLTAGEAAYVSATVNEDATDKSLTWTSSDSNVASYADGVIYAVGAGSATISATANDGSGVVGYCYVTVNAPAPVNVPATSVTLEPMLSEITLKVGESADFTASVDVEATDKSLYWVSDDSNVASVDNGHVTANGSGRTTIYAVANGDTAYAECTVIVIAEPSPMYNTGNGGEQQPAVVEVTPTEITLSGTGVNGKDIVYGSDVIGQTFTLTASHTEQSGGNYTWTFEGDAIALTPVTDFTAQYNITVVKPGNATITIKHENASIADTTFNVTVNEPASISVSGVSLDMNELSLVAGSRSNPLAATIIPDNATDQSVIWTSSDETVATVSNGIVTAVAAGNATITVTTVDGNYTDSCEVSVTAATVPVNGITISASGNSVISGNSITFTASVNEDASDNRVVWSIGNNDLGTLVDNGNNTATFTCNKYPDNATSLTVTATPADGSNVSGSYSFTVETAPAVSIVCEGNLSQLTLKHNQGYSNALSASLSGGTATENFKWHSSDEKVIRVHGEGEKGAQALITVIAPGTAEVTVSHAGKTSAAFTVKVDTSIAITSITIADKLNLVPGDARQLVPTIYPDNASNRTLEWTSDNESNVTVDGNGIVKVLETAKVDSVAVIKANATDGSGKYATCTVTVVSSTIPVTKVTIRGTAPSIKVGETTSLGVDIEPSNATNTSVIWSSNNTSIASVDQNGFITAVAPGKTELIAKSVSDPTVQDTIDVYVSDAPKATGDLVISASPKSISTTNGYSVLTATVNGYVINSGVNWSVSDTNMASVSANGVVTAKRAGSFVVTGIYDNNGTRYSGNVLITATPVITSGNYSNYDGRNVMYFKTNQTYPSWRSTDIVSVDGMQLTHGQHCYVGSSPDGYVLVALNPQYLNTLPSSVVHTIRIGPASSPAVGYFRTYTGQGTVINGVMTGDENQAALWAALCLMGILGCATILISRRKDWNS